MTTDRSEQTAAAFVESVQYVLMQTDIRPRNLHASLLARCVGISCQPSLQLEALQPFDFFGFRDRKRLSPK